MREHWTTEDEPQEPEARALPAGWRTLPTAPQHDDEDDEEYSAENFSERELLARYLREAGQIPLLTPAAEVELFRQLEEGTEAERREARTSLIAANLRLVVGVARHYVGLGLSLPELVAEGNLGLIAAVDRFERARGHRFSTFARWPSARRSRARSMIAVAAACLPTAGRRCAISAVPRRPCRTNSAASRPQPNSRPPVVSRPGASTPCESPRACRPRWTSPRAAMPMATTPRSATRSRTVIARCRSSSATASRATASAPS